MDLRMRVTWDDDAWEDVYDVEPDGQGDDVRLYVRHRIGESAAAEECGLTVQWIDAVNVFTA